MAGLGTFLEAENTFMHLRFTGKKKFHWKKKKVHRSLIDAVFLNKESDYHS